MIKTIGIIGYGQMGQFIAQHLRADFKQKIYDPKSRSDLDSENVELDEVCKCDVLVLALPVQNLEKTLKTIGSKIPQSTIVVDICSVKEIPMALMQKYLPKDASYVGTHPVFGPDSGKNGIASLPIAICKGRIPEQKYDDIVTYLQSLKLKIVECTPKEHDTQMAYGLALTHLISRSFQAMNIPKISMPTKSYKLMLEIKQNLSDDSDDLFITIQKYNPYAEQVRKQFQRRLNELEDLIEST